MPSRVQLQKALLRFKQKYVVQGSKGCWQWKGGRNPEGYPLLHLNGKMVPAHRFSYKNVGKKNSKQELDHTCGNSSCVNPRHLEPVTHQENSVRREERKRSK